MDYTGILKKAWSVTWRYKILWLFGLFAGSGGGSSGGGGGGGGRSGWDYDGGDMGLGRYGDLSPERFMNLIERFLPLILLAVLFLVALGLLLWIVSVAARGGIIHLVDEAEEGRAVRGGDGWSFGFHHWGRLFGVGFLSALPAVAVAVLLIIVGAIGAFGIWAAGEGGGRAGVGGAVFGVTGLCLFLVVAVAALVFFGVVFGIVRELALRYVILEERRVMDALKQGWRDLWGKRGAFVMWLITVGTGIAFGIVVAIVAVVLIVPGVLMATVADMPFGWALVVVASLLLLVPIAIYGAFYHSMWTIFFRRMTGRERVAVAPVMAPVPPAYPPVQPREQYAPSAESPRPPEGAPMETPVPPSDEPPPPSDAADV